MIILNYIDDLIHVGLPSNINQSYQVLLTLLADLDLQIKNSKLATVTEVVCLIIFINTVSKTMSIPQDKLLEIMTLSKNLEHKTVCTVASPVRISTLTFLIIFIIS